jgi:hypothetical protein
LYPVSKRRAKKNKATSLEPSLWEIRQQGCVDFHYIAVVFFIVLKFCVVLCIVCFVSLCVLSVCKCVLYNCHRVATHLQLTNIPYHNEMSYLLSGKLQTYPNRCCYGVCTSETAGARYRLLVEVNHVPSLLHAMRTRSLLLLVEFQGHPVIGLGKLVLNTKKS